MNTSNEGPPQFGSSVKILILLFLFLLFYKQDNICLFDYLLSVSVSLSKGFTLTISFSFLLWHDILISDAQNVCLISKLRQLLQTLAVLNVTPNSAVNLHMAQIILHCTRYHCQLPVYCLFSIFFYL